jgi:hypothetical protein
MASRHNDNLVRQEFRKPRSLVQGNQGRGRPGNASRPDPCFGQSEESCQGETQQGRLSKTGPNPFNPAYMRTHHRHMPRERIRHRVQKESSRSLPRNPCSCETHHIVARGYATTQQGDRTKHSTALLPFALSARQLRATPYTCFHCDIVAVIRDDFHSVDDPGIALRCVWYLCDSS